MLVLPESALLNRRLLKQTLYGKLTVKPALKRSFAEQVKSIVHKYQLKHTHLNVAAGEYVPAVQVFQIALLQSEYNPEIVQAIDAGIPTPALFLMEYQGQYQACISYKVVQNKGAVKLIACYHTEGWRTWEELPCRLQGLTLDAVYENLVRQIAGASLPQASAAEPLAQTVQRAQERQKLEKQITALQNKIRREKQLNIQMELNAELKKLKNRLENI